MSNDNERLLAILLEGVDVMTSLAEEVDVITPYTVYFTLCAWIKRVKHVVQEVYTLDALAAARVEKDYKTRGTS